MTSQLSLLPDTAPFNDEQRAWLNGFLAGWMGLQADPRLVQTTPNDIVSATPLQALAVPELAETFPWHDPAMPMAQRLQLAESKPLSRQLMAAMAQLDCGSCGYDCQRYAEAIAAGEEKSLKLCSPGGTETARKLKELVTLPQSSRAEVTSAPAPKPSIPSASAATTSRTWNRSNPYTATVLDVRNLNGEGSAKHTSHVEIDLAGSGLAYEVGDALGVYPTNCGDLVDEILGALGCRGDEVVEIDGKPATLRESLRDQLCLTEITDELVAEAMERCSCDVTREWLRQAIERPDLIDGWDVLDLLRRVPVSEWPASQVARILSRLKPRLYSISSSLAARPNQVHLTVGKVSWVQGGRTRKGVASTMFAERLKPGHRVRIFVKKSHGFTVPRDAGAAAIMIGPGTGIAPFRAFLQERQATQSPGKNWLFFGDQCSATDFLYREELQALQDQGVLNRLSLAFSRDQPEKVYVQHRLLEHGEEVWNWLDNGSHLYVCGDAKRMAVDVDQAVRQIVMQFGRRSQSEADAYLTELSRQARYSKDVY